MPNNKNFAPRQYKGVMISSTFDDLKLHRRKLMEALEKEGLFPRLMENYVPAPDDDIISSSLNMVREASAYIGLISNRYGQIIECAERNPHSYSVSRLEFEEAQRLKLPTLVFIMGEDHDVKLRDIETNEEKIKKLQDYRERAKEGRIYEIFNSLEDFTTQAVHAIANLRLFLDNQTARSTGVEPVMTQTESETNPIPTPPTFYAEPRYIGLHDFVGRKAQLETLSEWASPADPHPVLLFEAIGGSGKSMLTWEWTTNHSTLVRNDWAGQFWYSFYEKGAIMTDFCQRALAYMTGQPIERFRKKKIAELSELLLRRLQDRPWLLILDGLERVLVAYHRLDAAQVADEQIDTAEDQIAKRDPYAAIRPEDDDLLRALAAAAPSKLLITTRLTPRILISPSNQGIPGVRRVLLPGLRPADAEQLLRACGITGTSQEIQDYLKSHCDCHPLVTGVLAGLINDYLPDRGNFDAWATDIIGGGQLNLANLDLVQKRNHILLTAFAALPDKSRELLSTLAILSESVDFLTLSALNPHLPPEPEKVEVPRKPENNYWWDEMSDAEKRKERGYYEKSLQQWREYEQALKTRQQEIPFATQELTKTVRDLERRGLLQYDHQSKRYDLHPVVRGVAAGKLQQKDKERYGQRVVDHFSQQSHIPYEEAETLEDVRYGLNVVRTLLQMGHYEQACNVYIDNLNNALLFNLEAYAEILSITRPLFHQGWNILSGSVPEYYIQVLVSDVAIALSKTGELKEALMCLGGVTIYSLKQGDWEALQRDLHNISFVLCDMQRLAKMERLNLFALDIASLWDDISGLFLARLFRFVDLILLGRLEESESMWQILSPMGRAWDRSMYRPGDLEFWHLMFHFYQGTLEEEMLAHAEQLAQTGKNRARVRGLHKLRGQWRMEQKQWRHAVDSLHEAVRMARQIGQDAVDAEAMLSLAKFHLGELSTPRDEAERLAKTKEPPHFELAELWLAIGDKEQAKNHAFAAYKSAWADGEPFVFRYELNKARVLLEQLGAEIPNLAPYDPTKDEKFPWEDDVVAAIETLRAEKEEENEN